MVDDTNSPSQRMNLPPFAALRAFEAAFRLGGIRKAAASLGLHHAVVSRHIKQLENSLGVQLTLRQGNRIALTDAAAAFHARISVALADIDAATDEVTGNKASRHIRLWCSPSQTAHWLLAQLHEFEKANPGFEVELQARDMPADLLAYEADVEVRHYPDDHATGPGGKGLSVLELARPEVVAIVSRDFVRQHTDLTCPQDLLDLPLLHGGPFQSEWRRWLEMQGVSVPEKLPGIHCLHSHMIIPTVKLGHGIMLGSRVIVHRDIAHDELVELEIPGVKPVAIGSYVFVAREDRWSTPTIAKLRKFLAERMRPLGTPTASAKI